MKCRSYLIGVVSGLLLATAQAQSGSELNAAPFHENQSPSQYEETFHPPLPDIWVDGVLMSWEEVYGPIVILPPPVADNLSRNMYGSQHGWYEYIRQSIRQLCFGCKKW